MNSRILGFFFCCCRNYEIIKRFAFYSKGYKEIATKRWKNNVAINGIAICFIIMFICFLKSLCFHYNKENYKSIRKKIPMIYLLCHFARSGRLSAVFSGHWFVLNILYTNNQNIRQQQKKDIKSYMEICLKAIKHLLWEQEDYYLLYSREFITICALLGWKKRLEITIFLKF